MSKEICIIYADEDNRFCQNLERCLRPLERDDLIRIRHHGQIQAGQPRAREIEEQLNAADIILLLVSRDLFASNETYHEIIQAMRRFERNEVGVIPIIIRACNWKSSIFGHLEPLPNDRPISMWPNQDEAYNEVCKGIERVITKLTQRDEVISPSPVNPPSNSIDDPATPSTKPEETGAEEEESRQPGTISTPPTSIPPYRIGSFFNRFKWVLLIILVIILIVATSDLVRAIFMHRTSFIPISNPSTPTSTLVRTIPSRCVSGTIGSSTLSSIDPQHTHFNPGEHFLSSKNVAMLTTHWWKQLGGGVYTIPAIAGNTIYVEAVDHNLYALNAMNANLEWKAYTGKAVSSPPSSPVQSSPAIAGDTVYIGSEDGYLYAFSIQGSQRWKTLAGDNIFSTPVVAGGLVYIGSHNGKLIAFDAITGVQMWSFATKKGMAIDSSPAVADGIVYFGSDDGNVYALNAKTGQCIWMQLAHGNVDSSPAVVDGVVYFGSTDGKLYALDAKTGEEEWEFQTQEYIFSSPAVDNNIVYIGSHDMNLYAISTVTHKKLWQTPGIGDSSPIGANGVVYVVSGNGTTSQSIYALDASNGDMLSHPIVIPGGIAGSSLCEANGNLYVGSKDGKLYDFYIGPTR